MKKVIKNGLVITMDETRKEQIEKLDIVIEDDKIIDILPSYKGKADYEIDAKGKVVMPGLINAHTHLGMSVFRATNDSLPLNSWLNDMIWPVEDKLTNEDVYYTTLLSCYEMIKTGTTTCNDMYFNTDGSIKALKESKIRTLFSRCLLNSDGLGEEKIKQAIELYNNYKDEELIKFSIAPHAMYTCDSNYLKECSSLASNLNLPIHMHFCEDINEVKGIEDTYKKSPVNAIKDIGLLEHKLILAHGTFISKEDLKLFKGKDVSIVHNPVSNLNLGCGIANIVEYKDYANVCLGTDGSGSGNNMNMFYHMSLVDLLQKGIYKDPTIMNSYEVLKMATVNGAKALGFSNIGTLKIGNKADIIILDMNDPLTYPSIKIINNIVHNGWLNTVDTTIINGEVLMENKELKIDINIEEIKKQIDKIKNKMD